MIRIGDGGLFKPIFWIKAQTLHFCVASERFARSSMACTGSFNEIFACGLDGASQPIEGRLRVVLSVKRHN